jgi:hypothetical protein
LIFGIIIPYGSEIEISDLQTKLTTDNVIVSASSAGKAGYDVKTI